MRARCRRPRRYVLRSVNARWPAGERIARSRAAQRAATPHSSPVPYQASAPDKRSPGHKSGGAGEKRKSELGAIGASGERRHRNTTSWPGSGREHVELGGVLRAPDFPEPSPRRPSRLLTLALRGPPRRPRATRLRGVVGYVRLWSRRHEGLTDGTLRRRSTGFRRTDAARDDRASAGAPTRAQRSGGAPGGDR